MKNRPVEITEVIDSAKFFGWPLGIAVLTTLIMLVDGFDLQTMPQVAPVLVNEWGVERAQLTWAISASMIGMALGSVVLGWLGDRIGRRNSYIVCIVFLFIGSLGSAYSGNLTHLFIWRFITGIGLGGVTPLATAFISEWTPKQVRNVVVACVIVAVPLGGMLGAQVAQWVIPTYGWRAMFFIGAATPFIFVLIAWFLLPESPKYMAQRPERHPELAKMLNRLLGEKRFEGTETFTVAEPPKPPGNWFSIIMRPPYLGTTLLLWTAFAANTLGLYAFVNWLPTVLESTGFELHTSLQGSKLFNFGGFFGAVGGAVLIGLLGSRIVGSSLSLVGAIATFCIGLIILATVGGDTTQMLILICIAGTALNGMQAFLYAVGAHSYPTYIRASGVGCAQTVSRLGGVVGSSAPGMLFAMQPQPSVSVFFYAISAVMLIVVISFFSLRTHIPGKKASMQLAAEALQKDPAQ